jgi:hypothetical protein
VLAVFWHTRLSCAAALELLRIEALCVGCGNRCRGGFGSQQMDVCTCSFMLGTVISRLLWCDAGLGLSQLLKPTSLAWIQTENRKYPGSINSYQTAVVSSSNISLGFIATADSIFAWATSHSDGQPVANVEISLHFSS